MLYMYDESKIDRLRLLYITVNTADTSCFRRREMYNFNYNSDFSTYCIVHTIYFIHIIILNYKTCLTRHAYNIIHRKTNYILL